MSDARLVAITQPHNTMKPPSHSAVFCFSEMEIKMDVTITKGFTQKTCGKCGVVFYVPDELEREYLKTNQTWTCPNGHSRSYSESQLDKYKKLYEQEKAERIRLSSVSESAIESAKKLRAQLEKCKSKKNKM